VPFRIQRVPRGLNELLSIFGGSTPTELEDRVQATLDLLQMYGLTQEQVRGANNPAEVENGTVGFVLSTTQWTVLFDLTATFIKTATMTALRASCGIRISSDVSQEVTLGSDQLGPFGATETGAAMLIPALPYPRLLAPNTLVWGRPNIIGTDANVNITVGAHFGVVGP